MVVRVQAGKRTSRVLGMRKLLTQLWEELGCEGLKGGDRGGGRSPGEAGQVEGAAQGLQWEFRAGWAGICACWRLAELAMVWGKVRTS